MLDEKDEKILDDGIILMITGSRCIDKEELIFSILDEYIGSHKVRRIEVGDASGVDEKTIKYAKLKNIPYKENKAKWDKFGNGAGVIRNSQMVKKAHRGIAIWDGKSKGTKDAIQKLRNTEKLEKIFYCRKNKKDVWELFYIKEE